MLDWQMEEAALNAWPALHQTLWAGWVLRFADGYTKRANSVTPLYDAHDPTPLQVKVAGCEQRYRLRGLPPIFRLVPIARLAELDELLAQRGYHHFDPSLVLTCETEILSNPATSARVERVPVEQWLHHFCAASGVPLAAQTTHQRLLHRLPPSHTLALVVEGETVVACGLAVAEGRYVGLFDLVTIPAFRRRGYGTHLVAALLQWGRAQGATTAYLQVVERNGPARRLYERLGFAEAYRYWYRVPEDVAR